MLHIITTWFALDRSANVTMIRPLNKARSKSGEGTQRAPPEESPNPDDFNVFYMDPRRNKVSDFPHAVNE